MAPYDYINLGQHCFRQWLVGWWYQAVTWTNIDEPSVWSCGMHLWTSSHEMNKIFLQTWFWKLSNKALQWRHTERDGVSNHRRHDCLLNRLFRRISKKTSKLRGTLAFVRGIHRWPVNSPHKGQVARKLFPFDDVIMDNNCISQCSVSCDMCLGSSLKMYDRTQKA